MSLAKIWVDPGFRKMLKRKAVEEEIPVSELTRRIAKAKRRRYIKDEDWDIFW